MRLLGLNEQIRTEVLAIGVSIDFNSFIQFSGEGKNARPLSRQTHPVVVNTSAWMPEYLDSRMRSAAR